jgi:ribonuclease T2
MKKITLAIVWALIGCSSQQPPPVGQVPQEAAKPSAPAEGGKASPPPTTAPAEGAASTKAAAPTEKALTPTIEGTVESEKKAESGKGKAGEKVDYALYLLALSWAPNFCADKQHKSKEQCKELKEDSFAAKHLTIHGLWPNYDDQQSKGKPEAWPSFCAPYNACKKDETSSCDPDPSSIPADMKKYGPGYVTDNNFLADHEWPKHGSCTGLDAGKYFQQSIDALRALPGDDGTPKPLADSIGKRIKATELRAAFEDPSSVVLSCDPKCNLSQVGICLASGSDGLPKGRTACPTNVTESSYDNGCLRKNRCPNIMVQSVKGSTQPAGGDKCSPSKGQGPACSSDDFCKEKGFKRCAKSGCCTNVPK